MEYGVRNGWNEVARRGSHRQFKHRSKPGPVTVAGKPSDGLAAGTLNSNLKQPGLKISDMPMRYAIVIEIAGTNFSAYVPDLPGCVATGATVEETEKFIREAIEFHIGGMRSDNFPAPEPSTRVDYVEVAALWKSEDIPGLHRLAMQWPATSG